MQWSIETVCYYNDYHTCSSCVCVSNERFLDGRPSICNFCAGAGIINSSKDHCNKCRGRGAVEDPKTFDITISPGTVNGKRFVFSGQGDHLVRQCSYRKFVVDINN